MTRHAPPRTGSDAPVPDTPLGHAGEREMRDRFPGDHAWSDRSLEVMMRPDISVGLARFITALPFFFIATSSAEGHCDCSFRGQEHDPAGTPLPALRVADSRTLVFPDFAGNGLYNSLGNMRVNPHVGMLFVDFPRQRRARINGIARVIEAGADIRATWPTARAAVRVTVEQAYGNCPARIPRMTAPA